ncbi:DNA polymerase III subunit delta [Candidatus Phytoplasma fraxini]|uniref:DNA-directed DNA polymerase n=1 Tax=Ash yellows phytoplasma TaxID=35780 RepID=A0ABZ2U7L0_ASHYP
MKNNYLNLFIYEEKNALKEAKHNLKDLCQKQNYQFLFFSIQEDNYMTMAKNIAKELFTGSFLYNKKVLFIENISFLFFKKNINLKFLLDFFGKPNKNIIIHLNETKQNNFPEDIQKKININFNIKKKYKLNDQNLFNYIKNNFQQEGFTIHPNVISFLHKKTKKNLSLLKQDIQKIKLYYASISDKQINNIEIIKQLIFIKDENIFSFIKSIINNSNAKDSFLLLESIINNKKDPVYIIYQILHKLQDMILLQHLLNEGKTENEISNILQYHTEKTFFLIKEMKFLSINKIKNLLLKFINLYYKIKKGHINGTQGLKFLIINRI